ncbi:MAG: T9SS type A sorting domain-containing protein, partial [Bacteroidales bacterium]|nr:T9SS type A sorting domain-containing protein [Bacteroidales bacterium]
NITTLESCLRPSDFALAGITETTATIAWTENGGATSWNIEYGVEGFELGTGISINHITTNPYNIVGLADATRYDCYIQSICSADNQSIWVGPISFSAGSIDCGVIGEGTVGTNSLPVNTFYNHSYTQQIFRVDELSDLGIGAGEIKSVAFQYFYSIPQTKDNITIYLCNTSKDEFVGSGDWESVDNMQIVFTGSITFDNSGDDYWVEVPFTQNFFWNGTSNLLIAVLNNHGAYTTSSNNTFYTHSTEDDLSIRYQVDGSSPINPASLTSGSSSSSRNNIKLCFVESEVPTCSRPSNVAITNSTATTAQITWSSSGATSWNIELGERGFNPTMIPTYSNISNPYTLTNLTPNVEYAFYLQSNCSGNEVSDWIGPFFFNTACDMVLDIPVTEGFENGEKPECWQNIQIEGSGNWSYQAGVIEADPQTAFEGNYNALLYSPNISITRLVTPTINLSGLTQTPILAFAYAQPSWGFGQDKLSIWVKNSSTSNWSKIAEYSDNVEEWIEESIVLPDPSATYWIAFEVEGNWGHGVGLDEVKVLQEQVAPIQGNSDVCAQVTETYTTTAGMSGYVWNVLGGEITSGQGTNTITVLWGEAGYGRIDVIYDGLNYNNNVSVTIGDSPLAAVYASEEEICTGQSSVLTVVGEGNYLWSTGETTSTIVVSPSTTTTYTVLVYENQQCATELEIQIVVNAFTDIDILGNNNICYGESTVLTAVGGTQFLWTTGETSASVEVQPENTTFYSVIISNELGCSNMDSICVYVTQPPTPANLMTEMGISSIVLNWDLIPDITKYYIYRDEQLIDSSTFNNYEDVSVMMNVEYCYAVASVVNHCESELSNTHCNTLTGINENDADQQIRIYPNPANANITINGNNMSQITVFNVLGQQMESNSVSNPTTMTINTSSYESGIYLIRITMKDGSEVSKRVVVTH